MVVQLVFVSVMTTRTSFPQRGQRISTSGPLSPLHNLYPHIGHDAYIFMIVFFIGMRIQLVIMSHICYNENTKRNFMRCA